MLLKVCEIILNYSGALNFHYDKIRNCFTPNKLSLFISFLIFALVQFAMFLQRRIRYYQQVDGTFNVYGVAYVYDQYNWEFVTVYLYLEKVLCGHRYIALMNMILQIECWDVEQLNRKWCKQCIRMAALLSLDALIFLPIMRVDSFLFTLIRFVYGFIYPLVISTIFVEVSLCKRLSLHSNEIQKRLTHRHTTRKLYELFNYYNHLEEIVKVSEEILNTRNMFLFLFICPTLPLNAFFVYLSSLKQVQPSTLFWLFQCCILLFTRSYCNVPRMEVSSESFSFLIFLLNRFVLHLDWTKLLMTN